MGGPRAPGAGGDCWPLGNGMDAGKEGWGGGEVTDVCDYGARGRGLGGWI